MKQLDFFVNGSPVTLQVDPARPLLDVLRDELGLTGTKQGCDHEGECGACTVLVAGRAVRSCLTPVGKVAGQDVHTVEGLGAPGQLHPLQEAFIETGAVQCGYCTPGILMSAKALLDREPEPTRAQIVEALEGNLCRCTGYRRILIAVELAATRLRGTQPAAVEDVGQIIGGDTRRYDAVAKVTGQAKFVEDIVMPDMLHAKTLRSPHHHARLLGLNVELANAIPGVVRILTADDVPGVNGLGDFSQVEPVLTPLGATLKMLGAPIALVIATSPQAAQAGLEAIRVEYEELPYAFDVEEVLKPDALPIHENGNVLTTDRVAHGDLDAALAKSDVILETRYRTAYLEHAALEREAMLGYLDDEGRVTVAGATHEPHWHQGYIAAALGLDPDQVRFVTPPIGGSFGGKQDPWPAVAAGLATYHVRRPVRLAYSRNESFDFSPKRHPYLVDYRIGATNEGRLTGIRVRISANTGGYDAHGQYIPNFAITASGGPYYWQAVDAYAQSVYTNGPKSGQFRGFGTSQSAFALECTLDELCQRLSVDPLAFRRDNALEQDGISFLGYPVGESLGYAEVLDAIEPYYQAFLEEATAFNAVARENGRNATLRKGVGLSGMWYRFGKSGSLRVAAHAELAHDGHFVVYCSAPDYGQGTNAVMTQMAAETLGVSREQIELVNADTALVPDSGIQGASRSAYFVGGAVCQAVHNLRLAIDATASEMLDCPPLDLALEGEKIVCRSDPARTISLAAVAREFDRVGRSRKIPGYFDLSDYFPEETRPLYIPCFVTGAQLAEVIVDLRTGMVQVPRMVAAHDVGRAVNPVDAQGQIEGAIVMGLGAALMEEVIPGTTTGFGAYYLPTIKSMPDIEVLLVEVPSLHGPYGVKGLGEAAMLPSTPAIINAVSRAIGARIRQLPATPERVLVALQEGKARGWNEQKAT
jgi:CO/xanthine dehydrogenase Mo-binding subunit/aerobic-type carbon monoxide dehydrogenase small subunit (CoxS/CutS family)